MRSFSLSLSRGFTLIEMLIALSLFTIIATIVAGSLLVLIHNNQQNQGQQSVMIQLSFALDSMTREIRTGSHYWCITNIKNYTNSPPTTTTSPHDCITGTNAYAGNGVSFIEAGNSITGGTTPKRIGYYYDVNHKMIMRRVGNATAQSIISSNISIDAASFYVTGSTPLKAAGHDVNQPTVTIVLKASSKDTSDVPYTIETTITERGLDL